MVSKILWEIRRGYRGINGDWRTVVFLGSAQSVELFQCSNYINVTLGYVISLPVIIIQ